MSCNIFIELPCFNTPWIYCVEAIYVIFHTVYNMVFDIKCYSTSSSYMIASGTSAGYEPKKCYFTWL